MLVAHKQLRSAEGILNGQLKRLEEFSGEPSPPDRATFEKLAAYWRGAIAGGLDIASDEIRTKFAELFELYVTVHPNKSSEGYHFDITGSIPLEMEGNTVSAYDTVFNPTREGRKERGAKPLLDTHCARLELSPSLNTPSHRSL